MDFTAIRAGEKQVAQIRKELKGIAGKGRLQIQKDYVGLAAAERAVSTAAKAGVDAIQAEPQAQAAQRRGCAGVCRG